MSDSACYVQCPHCQKISILRLISEAVEGSLVENPEPFYYRFETYSDGGTTYIPGKPEESGDTRNPGDLP